MVLAMVRPVLGTWNCGRGAVVCAASCAVKVDKSTSELGLGSRGDSIVPLLDTSPTLGTVQYTQDITSDTRAHIYTYGGLLSQLGY